MMGTPVPVGRCWIIRAWPHSARLKIVEPALHAGEYAQSVRCGAPRTPALSNRPIHGVLMMSGQGGHQ